MNFRIIHAIGLFLATLAAGMRPESASAQELLTNAADILSLPADKAAQRVAVSITGVVTAAEPGWRGKFFVQDATGGVFINNTNDPQPSPGDFVWVRGVSHPGGYAPDIYEPHTVKLGLGPLPLAKPISAEQLMSGLEDGQRVEVSAVVRSVQVGSYRISFELAAGGYRFHAFTPLNLSAGPEALVGATVRVRGTAAASFNAPLRHIRTVVMYVPQPTDFIIDRLPVPGVFEDPFTPLNATAQYRRNATPNARIRVKGVVTYQRPGEDLFLLDISGGLQVKFRQTNLFLPGDEVEAIGFPDVDGFLPVLQNAEVLRTGEPRQSILPANVSFDSLLEGRHHSEFISLRGKLLDMSFRRAAPAATRLQKIRRILTLQNSDFLFTAEAPMFENGVGLADIPLGSTLQVSGICVLQIGEAGKMESLHLLIPSAGNIRILQQPSWWTAGRLLTVLAIVLVVLVVAITWTIMILRRNRALRASIAEKEAAQGELQKAHDLLETRVQERTQQLKVEMTARKEEELQFRATLTERTRLAQELHDTLEQTMTGIGLQLDAASQLFKSQSDRAGQRVELARNLMTQCQVELRRSIWDLRSRELEQFDLLEALLASGRQMIDGASIHLRVATEGRVRRLPEVVEENLLRIGQEALTNLVKHSGAGTATVTLQFLAQSVVLKIQDDGKGFNLQEAAGPKQGHFGLVGIGERTKRLGGRLTLTSAPGSGTCVQVEIPFHVQPVQASSLVDEPDSQ